MSDTSPIRKDPPDKIHGVAGVSWSPRGILSKFCDDPDAAIEALRREGYEVVKKIP